MSEMNAPHLCMNPEIVRFGRIIAAASTTTSKLTELVRNLSFINPFLFKADMSISECQKLHARRVNQRSWSSGVLVTPLRAVMDLTLELSTKETRPLRRYQIPCLSSQAASTSSVLPSCMMITV